MALTTSSRGDTDAEPVDDGDDGPPSCPACRATPRLTGMTRQEFDGLAARLEPVWQQRRREALDRPGRLAPIGGGRRFSLPFGSRLLLAVLHLRWSVTYRGLGAMFGVGSQTVERACRDLRPLLSSTRLEPVEVPYHRGSQLLLATLEDLGVRDRRDLLEAIGRGPCPHGDRRATGADPA